MVGMASRTSRWTTAFLAIAVLALAAAVAAPSARATDSWPCGGQTTKPWSSQPVQPCPLTPAGALAPNGWVPVYTSPIAVADNQQPPAPAGWLHGIDGQYFVCDRYIADADYNHPTQTWHHHWWAYTLADSPAVWGWVNETYFKGGDDDEADAGLRRCPSGGGAPAPTAASPQPPVVTAPGPATAGSPTPPASVAAPTTDPVLPSPSAPAVNPTGVQPARVRAAPGVCVGRPARQRRQGAPDPDGRRGRPARREGHADRRRRHPGGQRRPLRRVAPRPARRRDARRRAHAHQRPGPVHLHHRAVVFSADLGGPSRRRQRGE